MSCFVSKTWDIAWEEGSCCTGRRCVKERTATGKQKKRTVKDTSPRGVDGLEKAPNFKCKMFKRHHNIALCEVMVVKGPSQGL